MYCTFSSGLPLLLFAGIWTVSCVGWISWMDFAVIIWFTREEGVRKDQISLTVLFNSDSLCWLGYVKFPTPH